jgi:hypothetical protein
MDFKDAVRRAKSYVADILQDEHPLHIGLEEIEYDDASDVWNVTIGFERPAFPAQAAFSELIGRQQQRRDYRVVRVRASDGVVLSMRFLDPTRP